MFLIKNQRYWLKFNFLLKIVKSRDTKQAIKIITLKNSIWFPKCSAGPGQKWPKERERV